MIELPDPQSSETLADWVELQLALGNQLMSRDEVSSAVEAVSGTEPDEALISDVWRELTRRQALYRLSLYKVETFSVKVGSSVSTTSPAYVAYKACLILSLYGVHDQDVPNLFERLTRCAVEQYLAGAALVCGWNGSGISKKMQQIADGIGERFATFPNSRFKDRGVDVIGWKPFHDRRSGQTVLLTQCAAGHNWRSKTPVPVRAWEQYIHWAVAPNYALAIPCIVKFHEWHDKSCDMGLLFDRARLINLLKGKCKDSKLAKDLSLWVEKQVKDKGVDDE